jgi:hypothetical protein
MNIDELITRNALVFSVLLSGVSFVGLFTKTDNTFSAAICTIFVLMLLMCAFFLCEKLFSCCAGKIKTFPVFCFFGFLSGVFLYAAYSEKFVETQKLISGEFEGGRFSAFFIVLSLILALYMGKRGLSSISRICFLLLPILIFPYIITIFDFLGHRIEIKNLIPESVPHFDIKYFLSPVCAFGSCFFLFPLFEKDKKMHEKRNAKYYTFAFLITAVFCVLEYMKYLLWFGREGLSSVGQPDRIMLSQVPFMNVQEIYLVSYYTAYMIKISLFCTCARKYFEKILLCAKLGKETALRGGYTAAFLSSLTAYFFLRKGGEDLFLMLCPAALGVIFVVIFLTALSGISEKRHKDIKKPHFSQKSL